MAHIPLPNTLLSRLRQAAERDGLSLTRLFEKMLDVYLAHNNGAKTVGTLDNHSAQSTDTIDAEANAFLELHPTLLQNYRGHYVAIYQGQLVDHDTNKLALYARIEAKYPDDFVLMRRVEEQPEREIHFRSPRHIERI